MLLKSSTKNYETVKDHRAAPAHLGKGARCVILQVLEMNASQKLSIGHLPKACEEFLKTFLLPEKCS